MTYLTPFMTAHHQVCDALFYKAEQAAQAGLWDACRQAAEEHLALMEAHFDAEEEILMRPYLITHPEAGATISALIDEHRVMRSLLRALVHAADATRRVEFHDTADALLILAQQHYLHEEHIFYPLWDETAHNSEAQIIRLRVTLGEADR